MAHWDGPPLSAWAPWSPQQAARELAGLDVPWCVIGGSAIDLFLGESTRSHDDLEIAIPRAAFAARVPFLNPEGVLLYKAKTQRPKDEQDFAAVRARLEPQMKTWLREALLLVHPGHAWIDALA